MRQVVMTFGNADLGKRTVAAIVCQQHGGDARGVRLKRKQDRIEHHLNMFRVGRRDAGGRFLGGIFGVAQFFRTLNPRLQFAHAGEVLIQFVLVVCVELALHVAGVGHHEIEDGTLLHAAPLQFFGAVGTGTGAEEPFKNLARIQRSEKLGDPKNPAQETPAGIPATYAEHIQVMFNTILLAFQTDSTRIATMLLAHDGSNRSFAEIGIPEGHHDLSHHDGNEEKIKKISDIDLWYVKQLAGFLGKLRDTRDVDGKSLLDNSMIVYGGGNADGNRHTHVNLPVLLAGGGGGTMTPGRFVKNESTPLTNLYLSMADRMGVKNLERFGDSTGRLANI